MTEDFDWPLDIKPGIYVLKSVLDKVVYQRICFFALDTSSKWWWCYEGEKQCFRMHQKPVGAVEIVGRVSK